MSTKKSGKKTSKKAGTTKVANKKSTPAQAGKTPTPPLANTGRRPPLNLPVHQQPAAKNAARSVQPIRWAHPFFTTTPRNQRKPVPGIGNSLTDHIKGNLEAIPAPSRVPLMTLPEIIGQAGSDEIQAAGSILFHTAGDTGRGMDTPQ